jgi:hypothetical protein
MSLLARDGDAVAVDEEWCEKDVFFGRAAIGVAA